MSRPKRVKLGLAIVEAHPRWHGSTIVFKEYQGDEMREVSATIVINDPWDLAYVRKELDKIEAHWRKSLP